MLFGCIHCGFSFGCVWACSLLEIQEHHTFAQLHTLVVIGLDRKELWQTAHTTTLLLSGVIRGILEMVSMKTDTRGSMICDDATMASARLGIEILDYAREWGQWEIFNWVVQQTNPLTLTILFENGEDRETILHHVSRVSQGMNSVKVLVQKCPYLTQITDSKGLTPLYTAIEQCSDSDLIWYLTLVTTNEAPSRPLSDSNPDADAGDLFYCLLTAGYSGITHFILQKYPLGKNLINC